MSGYELEVKRDVDSGTLCRLYGIAIPKIVDMLLIECCPSTATVARKALGAHENAQRHIRASPRRRKRVSTSHSFAALTMTQPAADRGR